MSQAEARFAALDAMPVEEVVRSGRAEENIKAMDDSIARITEAQAELARRGEQARRQAFRDAVDAMPRVREMERNQRKPHPRWASR